MLFLLMSKTRNMLFGYLSKPFSEEEIEKCVKHDISIVDGWLECLKEYAPDYAVDGKHILELGPGSDLGIGLYLLSKSAKKYTAIDVYDLVSKTSPKFYDSFFSHLKSKQADTASLEEELRKFRGNEGGKLNYAVRGDFDLAKAMGDEKVDAVFSNSAFCVFEDVEKTIRDVSRIALPGAVFIASIDLKSLSRWIRDKDPNNVYRYSKWLYRLLSFRSSPNRVRPWQYKKFLEENGWKDVVIKPRKCLDRERLDYFRDYLDDKFKDEVNQMEFLSIWVCARKL
jgi:SAM-dependent methyltransferase